MLIVLNLKYGKINATKYATIIDGEDNFEFT